MHILVNNAGIIQPSPILECSEASWDQIINTNLKGAFLCTTAVGKYMAAQKYGKIINIASTGAFKANPYFAAYHASKGGMLLFTKSVAAELIRYNINVNAIAPGLVTTDLTATATEEQAAKQVKGIPIRRFGEPEEIAPTAVFLASDLSGYMVGECVAVDGGMLT